jgi:hypothetical protein
MMCIRLKPIWSSYQSEAHHQVWSYYSCWCYQFDNVEFSMRRELLIDIWNVTLGAPKKGMNGNRIWVTLDCKIMAIIHNFHVLLARTNLYWICSSSRQKSWIRKTLCDIYCGISSDRCSLYRVTFYVACGVYDLFGLCCSEPASGYPSETTSGLCCLETFP